MPVLHEASLEVGGALSLSGPWNRDEGCSQNNCLILRDRGWGKGDQVTIQREHRAVSLHRSVWGKLSFTYLSLLLFWFCVLWPIPNPIPSPAGGNSWSIAMERPVGRWPKPLLPVNQHPLLGFLISLVQGFLPLLTDFPLMCHSGAFLSFLHP